MRLISNWLDSASVSGVRFAALAIAVSALVPAFAEAGSDSDMHNRGVVTVAEMHWAEPYAPMVFHADHLWVGQSRSDKGLDYRVAVFDRNDQLVQEIPVRHSPSYMSVYDDSSILVTGTSGEPNLTGWTVIKRVGEKFVASHHWIPAEAWSNGWLGTISGREYFADIGGNPNDGDMSDNPTLAAQTIFSISRNGGRPAYSTTRMRTPMSGWRWGSQFVILRGDSIISPARNVVVFNPASGVVRDAVGRSLNGAGEPALLADGKRIVIAEQNAGKILFADLDSGDVSEFVTDGTPKAVATLGRCSVAGFETEKKGLILDAPEGQPVSVAGSFDFSGIDDRFLGLRRVTVDSVTGRIYGSSVYACNPFFEDCSKKANLIFAVKPVTGSEVYAKCLN